MAHGKSQYLFERSIKENIAGPILAVHSMHKRVRTPPGSNRTVVFARPLSLVTISRTWRRGLDGIDSVSLRADICRSAESLSPWQRRSKKQAT